MGSNRHSVNSNLSVQQAMLAIEAGEVILYPTDTLYGLGVDALSDSAVAKLYVLKGREAGKPTHAIVRDMEMAGRYGYVTDAAQKLADAFLPGPLTLVLKKREGIETGIAKGFDTFGIRIPKNDFCVSLLEQFGGPITTPSANRAGMHSMNTVQEILEQFGDDASQMACVIDAGPVLSRTPSTIVDCSGDTPVILREGAILSGDVWAQLAPEK